MATSPTVLSSSRLEKLPLIALDSICGYLAAFDSRRSDLFAFSRASKWCCSVATRHRYERIYLRVTGHSKLQSDVRRWIDLLAREGRVRYVRRVKVVGRIPAIEYTGRHDDGQPEAGETLAEDCSHFAEADPEGQVYKDNFLDLPKQPVHHDGLTEQPETKQAKDLQNQMWEPLAALLCALPALTDLVYACLDQVPPCLLTALHENHPHCRLHVHTFSLRSLFQSKDKLRDIDPDEFLLATSPCLYSLAMFTSPGYDTDGRVNYNDEALLSMASGLAPGLRHITLWHSLAGNSMALMEATRSPRPPWRGFFNNTTKAPPGPSKGLIEGLTLGGNRITASSGLMEWINFIKVSKLRELCILNSVSLDVLRTLSLMAADGQLKHLRRLSLEINPWGPTDDASPDEIVSHMLDHLAPLQELSMLDHVGPRTLHSILGHHSTSLRKLELVPTANPQMAMTLRGRVEDIRQQCQGLRELSLMIPRTKGDQDEVDMYCSLGKFKHITDLSLVFDCSNQQWRDLEEPRPSPALVRDILINTAVDSTLAQSIFRTICAAGSSSPSPLQTLRLSIDASAFLHAWKDYDFSHLVGWIGRSWLCHRQSQYDGAQEIAAVELQVQQRKYYGELIDDDWELSFLHGSVYEKVWKELWPGKNGDWKDDWMSFPLAGKFP